MSKMSYMKFHCRFFSSAQNFPSQYHSRSHLFIGGKWIKGSNSKRVIYNPSNEEQLMSVDEASSNECEQALLSARDYFDNSDWGFRPIEERVAMLDKMALLLQRDKEILATIESLDTGKTIKEARMDIDDVTATFSFFSQLALKEPLSRRIEGKAIPSSVFSQIVYEPVGVCVLIAPWNYPLLQMSWKVAPALVAGNTIVMKPSEVTPLSTIHFTSLLLEAGFPSKAINLILGSGINVGSTLTEHPTVDCISFTGGLSTGRRIIKSSADTIKRVTVELGGKNPNIVFADVANDLDRVADVVLTAVFLHSGQVCTSGTRLIVEESIAEKLVDKIIERAKKIRLGDAFDEKSEAGPLTSKEHLQNVEMYVRKGIDVDKARLRLGGTQPDRKMFPHLHPKGYYFLPTIFDKCHKDMHIVKEESFGPILTVETFKDEETAIKMANDTPFGLGAGVQSNDLKKASRVASRLRAGTVWCNTWGAYTPMAEWGGMKTSGNGRELGVKGLEEYREIKHIWSETNPQRMNWFG